MTLFWTCSCYDGGRRPDRSRQAACPESNNVVEVLSPEDWREEHDLRGDGNPRSRGFPSPPSSPSTTLLGVSVGSSSSPWEGEEDDFLDMQLLRRWTAARPFPAGCMSEINNVVEGSFS